MTNEKTYIMCLTCGAVQIRTDIEDKIEENYTLIKKEIHCPKCNKKVNVIGTYNIKTLEKRLETEEQTKMNNKIIRLLKRK